MDQIYIREFGVLVRPMKITRWFILILLLLGGLAGAQPVFSYDDGVLSQSISEALPMQQEPPIDSFQVTFEEMGYAERVLLSPWGSTQYSIRLPANWRVVEESYLDIEFSYFFTEMVGEEESRVEFFGEILISFDDRILGTYRLSNPELENEHYVVELPPELFNENPGASHQIEINLDASFLCNTLHKGRLIIRPTSLFFFNYNLLPPTLDLSRYPHPFYQGALETDKVRFILPTSPSEAELRAAMDLAAGLGDLTYNRVVISATTDIDWLESVETGAFGSEHLFVIGRPSRNRVIPWLSQHEEVVLPIPVLSRTLGLQVHAPEVIMPGDIFSYAVSITNTTATAVEGLSLASQLPYQSSLVTCTHQCNVISPDTDNVTWDLPALSSGESISLALTLRITDAVQYVEANGALESSFVLLGQDQSPMNAQSLMLTVGGEATQGEERVSRAQDAFFFVRDGRPVFAGDGILQEVISPLDPQQVILLVTGVNDTAVSKAGQALIFETFFPETRGPANVVRAVKPTPPVTTPIKSDVTLADLGAYSDKVAYGIYAQEIVYWFKVPLNWELTRDAYFQMFFSHSDAIDERASTLTVLINDIPMATVALNEENRTGSLKVDLKKSDVRSGVSNKLSFGVSMQREGEECADFDDERVWVRISRDSFLHLTHRTLKNTVLDLDYFPTPFDTPSDLSRVLFVLPPEPGDVDVEVLLRLAAALGDSAEEDGFRPTLSLGGALGTSLLSRFHIVAVGRPSVNPLLKEINAQLPQPFVPGTDNVEHQVGEVLFRLPPDISLGYIQELPSPWNKEHAFLAITGTTDEGMMWAVQALTKRSWQILGNLVLVRGDEEDLVIQSIDTRGLTESGLASATSTVVPEVTVTATTTLTSDMESGSEEPPATPTYSSSGPSAPRQLPSWVIAFAAVTLAVVLLTFGVAIWRLVRQGK